ncbi:MAG: FtsX-like permease family protein [Acetobacterium sp.]|uniref:ABC transporter permease n=1 Tax=Acetobacterium sp. TaxID=1872094 RepID=UPI003242ACF1
MKLLLNLVRKDFKRNPAITTALTVFLIMAALLMAGGLRVAGTMISAYDELNHKALPPDYLQMHKGEYQAAALEGFVASQDGIADFLTVRMLTIHNANIVYQGETLEKVLMDNSFVVQNQGFDYLLDMDNQIATVKDGEIGVPVYYAETLGVATGDVITLKKDNYMKEFKVATIIRDAQMNVAMTSSKRFLISPADQEALSQQLGEWEYSFEFLLKEGVDSGVISQAYAAAKLPANGVDITADLLNLFNVFSYGLVAMIIIVISLLLIFMAMLCLSFIIRATMADEQVAIGEMKAIGFPGKAIATLYQMKYLILMGVAGIFGYLGAIPFGNFFAAAVVRYCGTGSNPGLKWGLPFLGLLLLSGMVAWGCHRVVKKNLHSTVVELLRGSGGRRREGHYTLPSSGFKYSNLTIALGELVCKWREYRVILLVFIFSAFLLLLPMNMKQTIQDPSFITYMGVGEADIRIDIQYSPQLTQQQERVLAVLENDSDIDKYAIYKNGYVQAENSQGEETKIRVESGDEAIFPLVYLAGQAPVGKNEIALSSMNAGELGKKVGDKLAVVYDGETMELTVAGIYQDITYGGKTAKAAINFNNEDVEVYILYLSLADGVDFEAKTDELRGALPEIKVTPVPSFIAQTLGGIVDNLSRVEAAAMVIALLLSALVTVMFLQLVMAREHRDIAVKKALGLTNRDIRIQLGIRLLVIQGLGILIGTVLANTLGEGIFSLMLSSMGATRMTLLIQPLKAYLICPAIQLLVVTITAIGGTRAVKHYHIKEQIME